MTLIVEANAADSGCCTPLLDLVQKALVAADSLQRLPLDYTDVTQGWFASWKRWLKRKLLGNFKRAYVDVLSRQQTEFNQQLLTALRELAECCAMLDQRRNAQEEAHGPPPVGLKNASAVAGSPDPATFSDRVTSSHYSQ